MTMVTAAGDTPYPGSVDAEADDEPVVAQVRVATELYGDEIQGIRGFLERHVGSRVRLDIVQDPTILGGVWIRVNDTVIDGSIRGKLQQLRQHLIAQCRVIITNQMTQYPPETERR